MPHWFVYTGVGDPFLPGSYLRKFGSAPTCTKGCVICAVFLDDNSSTAPSNLTNSVIQDMINALATQEPQSSGGSITVRLRC